MRSTRLSLAMRTPTVQAMLWSIRGTLHIEDSLGYHSVSSIQKMDVSLLGHYSRHLHVGCFLCLLKSIIGHK